MKLTRSTVRTGLASVSYEIEKTAGRLEHVSEPIADGETDVAVPCLIDVSALKMLLIGSDQDVTLETNNPGGASAAPDQTITLKANQPMDWAEDDPVDCPLTADVSTLYVTNASGSTVNLEVRALQDATPE